MRLFAVSVLLLLLVGAVVWSVPGGDAHSDGQGAPCYHNASPDQVGLHKHLCCSYVLATYWLQNYTS